MYNAICWDQVLDIISISYTVSSIISYMTYMTYMTYITTHHVVSLLTSLVTVLVAIAYMVVAVVTLPNQQVTNSGIAFGYPMGTSEALRVMSFVFSTIPPIKTPTSSTSSTVSSSSSTDKSFNEWLSGVIDGDGSLLVSKSGYCSCEITMDNNDEHTLLYIKYKLGGSVSFLIPSV